MYPIATIIIILFSLSIVSAPASARGFNIDTNDSLTKHNLVQNSVFATGPLNLLNFTDKKSSIGQRYVESDKVKNILHSSKLRVGAPNAYILESVVVSLFVLGAFLFIAIQTGLIRNILLRILVDNYGSMPPSHVVTGRPNEKNIVNIEKRIVTADSKGIEQPAVETILVDLRENLDALQEELIGSEWQATMHADAIEALVRQLNQLLGVVHSPAKTHYSKNLPLSAYELASCQSVDGGSFYNFPANVDDGKKIVILALDESKTMQIQAVLSKDFHVVKSDHSKVVSSALHYRPHMIFFDIDQTSDIEKITLSHLAASKSIRHIPIILLTKESSDLSFVEQLELTSVNVIAEPLDLDKLLTKVKELACIDHVDNINQQDKTTLNVVKNCKPLKRVRKDPFFLKKLDSYIEKNIAEKITVEEMSSDLAMNRSAFTRKVKNMTSLNAQQYILHYRLTKAYDQLLSAQSVASVADKLGFSTQNHLSTAFTKQFGITCRDRIAGKNAIRNLPKKIAQAS